MTSHDSVAVRAFESSVNHEQHEKGGDQPLNVQNMAGVVASHTIELAPEYGGAAAKEDSDKHYEVGGMMVGRDAALDAVRRQIDDLHSGHETV